MSTPRTLVPSRARSRSTVALAVVALVAGLLGLAGLGTGAFASGHHRDGHHHASLRVQRMLAGSYHASYHHLSGGVYATGTAGSVRLRPEIHGLPVVGGRLRVEFPTPRHARVHDQWFVGGRRVHGATATSYRPVARDLGKRVTVRVVVKRRHHGAYHALSKPTAKVAPALIGSVKAPVVSGVAKVGHTLRVSTGSWKVGHLAYSYQWYANGHAIAHATSSRLKVTKALAGKNISVRVTARHHGFSPTTVRAVGGRVA